MIFSPFYELDAKLVYLRKAVLHAYITGYAVKTEATYFRQVWRTIREFHRGDIDVFEFIDDFTSFIDNQFNRAFRQGARDMNVDPRTFTDDDLLFIQERIEQEYEFILKLAEDIERARAAGRPFAVFRTRAEMWARRYNEIVSLARAHFGGRQLLEWVRNPEKDSCGDCILLDGVVATAEEWEASGWRPQSRDLECGGWFCGCSLKPTSKKPTPGGIPPKDTGEQPLPTVTSEEGLRPPDGIIPPPAPVRVEREPEEIPAFTRIEEIEEEDDDRISIIPALVPFVVKPDKDKDKDRRRNR